MCAVIKNDLGDDLGIRLDSSWPRARAVAAGMAATPDSERVRLVHVASAPARMDEQIELESISPAHSVDLEVGEADDDSAHASDGGVCASCMHAARFARRHVCTRRVDMLAGFILIGLAIYVIGEMAMRDLHQQFDGCEEGHIAKHEYCVNATRGRRRLIAAGARGASTTLSSALRLHDAHGAAR